MFIDRNEIAEYPYDGTFYTMQKSDADNGDPLAETTEEVVLLNTKCDIQEASKNMSGDAIISYYNIFFPFDKETGIIISRGVKFRGSAYGMNVEGTVVAPIPSQLGGCSVYIKVVDS